MAIVFASAKLDDELLRKGCRGDLEVVGNLPDHLIRPGSRDTMGWRRKWKLRNGLYPLLIFDDAAAVRHEAPVDRLPRFLPLLRFRKH